MRHTRPCPCFASIRSQTFQVWGVEKRKQTPFNQARPQQTRNCNISPPLVVDCLVIAMPHPVSCHPMAGHVVRLFSLAVAVAVAGVAKRGSGKAVPNPGPSPFCSPYFFRGEKNKTKNCPRANDFKIWSWRRPRERRGERGSGARCGPVLRSISSSFPAPHSARQGQDVHPSIR